MQYVTIATSGLWSHILSWNDQMPRLFYENFWCTKTIFVLVRCEICERQTHHYFNAKRQCLSPELFRTCKNFCSWLCFFVIMQTLGSAQSVLHIVTYSWSDVEWHTIFSAIYSGIPAMTYSGILIFRWCKVAYYFELVHGVLEVLITGRP